MNIQINICHTVDYGDELLLNIRLDDGGQQSVARMAMQTRDGTHWTCRLDDIDSKSNQHINYFFSVEGAGQEREREWTGILHRADINLTRATDIRIYNMWQSVPDDTRYFTTAYTECLCRRVRQHLPRAGYAKTLRLVVRAPELQQGERLAIVGDGAAMGEWHADRAVYMVEHNACEWLVDINAAAVGAGEYSFVAVGEDGTVEWETGPRRVLEVPEMELCDAVIYELPQARFNRTAQKVECVNVSVAGMRTGGSFGIGDFGDLADFVVSTADSSPSRMVFIPPVNDTISTHTNADATPYSSVSVYALHPLLCDLRQLAPINDPQERERMEALRLRLNALPEVDYSATLSAKFEYMHAIFQQEGDRTMRSAAFRHFFAANEHWLVPYAQYSYLRDAYGQADFRHWPNHNEWTEAERGQLQNPRTKAYKKLAFIYYVQFVLHAQLSAVRDVARRHGIVLGGDLTANINPNGCDVWKDADRVGADSWWTRRLSAMECFYDACRVGQQVSERKDIMESTRMWTDTFLKI